MSLWDQPLTEEQKQQLIEGIAAKTVQKGMGAPAILFLEMHKPLTYIVSQGAIAFSPFMAPLLGVDRVDTYTQLFSDRANVERLIQRIEELQVERDAERVRERKRLKEQRRNATR